MPPAPQQPGFFRVLSRQSARVQLLFDDRGDPHSFLYLRILLSQYVEFGFADAQRLKRRNGLNAPTIGVAQQQGILAERLSRLQHSGGPL
jgi:hypothetical protein